MRTKLLFSSLLCAFICTPLAAQTAGPISFDSTESALMGTVACNGGTATTISPVDASVTNGTGSNDAVASNLAATACGLPLYSIGSSNDATGATDTSTQDNETGASTVKQTSLLGGVVTYDSKTETDSCNAASSTEVDCTDKTTITNLHFAGNHITGTFTQPRTFNAVSVEVQLPGYCTGVALFTGQLTVNGFSAQASGNPAQTQLAPIALSGTLSCLGLPLTTSNVSLVDVQTIKEYRAKVESELEQVCQDVLDVLD